MANHGKPTKSRSKAYWARHYSKPSRAARTKKRAEKFAAKAA
jgi:hypothetical protein